jgi:hypothetical protein
MSATVIVPCAKASDLPEASPSSVPFLTRGERGSQAPSPALGRGLGERMLDVSLNV